jgi:hypothetical protein
LAIRALLAGAHECGCTPAQLAIAWCLRNPQISTVLLGASNREQLAENLGALKVLDSADNGVFDQLELLCWSWRYRMMYEPFHPASGVTSQHFSPNLYLRPGEQDVDRYAVATSVFAGNYYHPNVDRDNRRLLHRCIVAKDIFAHLFAAWVAAHFPHIRTVLVLRNPFEVALSKRDRQNWVWMTDATCFLEQAQLVADHLDPYVDLIRAASRDFVLQQILIWSVMHFVLFRQFAAERLFCIRYEEILASPQEEIQRLQAFVSKSDGRQPRRRNEDRVKRRSRGSARATPEPSAADPAWTSKLPSQQLDAGMRILEAFELHRFAGLH